ncbi:MAG: hypothetical protein Q7R39_00755, partial [Dehalococcoidia bacterium]|nr:hypothetical protein [Dehalococcoidia bacterium]
MISDIEMLNSSKLSLARSMAALHGLGDVDPRLAAVQQLSTVLDDARAAMNTAQAMVNDTPYATLNRAQLMGIWNANI